ncbi:hypothetical protein BVJ53_05500 [Lacticaseibacillus chiayiensis]|uniref:Uncharacterized protein n=1 Tax=Lacticaseibacillus chiayiensis TaxID=2100821 RepID=A0A4Q1U5I7_9LACO|nr:hypothetical protein [Lacticaseibacillus chiayiensis]QVI34008.1 hypothetical protein KG086_09395 [Lacticaseibacillus chiayiensis]RXT26809.1 hypothetical protein BVJ53_05500 [Lacticaseibacillus chiayiensis]UYN55783.1 hypothetical protein OFW50_09860 [Lacticaseibacillus chiayiensis]
MKKIWLTIAGFWLISVIYFLVYISTAALQTAVNANSFLSLVHGVMDLILLGTTFALVAGGLYRLFHRR